LEAGAAVRRLKIAAEDVVVADEGADLEGANAHLAEAVALVEAEGATVADVYAEEEAGSAHIAGTGDGGVQQLLSYTGALEFRKQVDALELEVRRAEVLEREVGRGEHGVAHGGIARADDGQPGADAVRGEVFGVRRRDVVPGAVLNDGGAGQEAGEGLQEGGCGDEGEGFGVLKPTGPECDGINSGHSSDETSGRTCIPIH